LKVVPAVTVLLITSVAISLLEVGRTFMLTPERRTGKRGRGSVDGRLGDEEF
jgi:hypothetical protein